MKLLTVSEAKKRFLEIVRDADESFEQYCITRNGVPKVIIMSTDDYESWLETFEILCDKESIKEIKRARKELNAGKGIPFEKILKGLHD